MTNYRVMSDRFIDQKVFCSEEAINIINAADSRSSLFFC